MKTIENQLVNFSKIFRGELRVDALHKNIYATDASVYRKIPLAIAFPKDKVGIQQLVQFANTNKTSLVPRTAGTSLAGQCVGEGIIVDVSKHFTKILSVDVKNKTVTLQPGVIRDDLNRVLAEHGLFFGPNTSTSNRCMIGGMVGNNSSGSTSIKYGVTRDKVLEIQAILSDGSEATFANVSKAQFHHKKEQATLEGEIYKSVYESLKDVNVQSRIRNNFPKPEIHRRNTGYAIDMLLDNEVFGDSDATFNMCKLLTGSEGTLAFTTQLTLQLDHLPPRQPLMVAAHFSTIEDCMQAVQPLMQHPLFVCEMMDKVILDCTKNNLTQKKNRFFIEGDPKAILMLQVAATTAEEAENLVNALLKTLSQQTKSYANPILKENDIDKAMELRSAGLGLLGNIVGDKKAVACIEDTAVAVADLANYIAEFTAIMSAFDQEVVYYAHAGAGEIHLRPILDLKTREDVVLFRKITTEVAQLVKKYQGSMSGEHGDGIVRAEFIPLMIGEENYELLKEIKHSFDPHNIFNPGKIVNAYKMDESLRYETDQKTAEIPTALDFSDSQGILRAAEKCNGSGDCRKPSAAGGTMCPSYRATRNEKDTTRARANALREVLTHSTNKNKFDSPVLKEAFDLCLSCKACASECPSNVDVAALKAEYLYQYQKTKGVSIRTRLFANNARLNAIGSRVPALTNALFNNKISGKILKQFMGVAQERRLPNISKISFRKYISSQQKQTKQHTEFKKELYFFVDEFSNFLDAPIAIDAYQLLTALGYRVLFVPHFESGRAHISKGLLDEAKVLANKNIAVFKNIISKEVPLIGLEPSAILSFRDEYLRLADDKIAAKEIASHTFLIDEFLKNEIELGNISSDMFTTKSESIKFHGHCHQKTLSNQENSFAILNLPTNYKVTIIASGCCGMAGSFGYEKEHYKVSMQIGEESLFPAVRKAAASTIIAATGTSCRHQIKDGTSKEALHPVSILRRALI
jgi:FAD/FMN-containing dehydrogenase/Fe-S oxidoreductase